MLIELLNYCDKKLDILLEKNNDRELDLVFYTYGCVNLYIKHFRGEIDYTLDEINDYVKDLAKKIFYIKK